MPTNDELILQLKKQIEDKKKALRATEKFTPITNCSIELDGVRQNIQVLKFKIYSYDNSLTKSSSVFHFLYYT